MQPEPRVLMVTGAYAPEQSGAGLQCRALVGAFGERVHCRVLTTTTDPVLPRDDVQDGVLVTRVYVQPTRLLSKVGAALRFVWIFGRLRPQIDVLHLHGCSQKSIWLVVLASLTRLPVLLKLTSVGHDDASSMRRRGRLWFWVYRRAALVVGVSPRFQQVHQAEGLPMNRFRLIPNGVDLARFRPANADERAALRRRLGWPADVTVVLCVGFFSREKAPDVLLDAWLRLPDAVRRRTRLVFVGATGAGHVEADPRLAEAMKTTVASSGVEAQVQFVEQTDAIEDFQRAADVFVLPSVREGLPNALLEAMACGLACVATQLPGVTDDLLEGGRAGRLVPAQDAVALSAALEGLLSDSATARELGLAAAARITQRYSLPVVAKRYLGVYRNLVAS